MSTRRIFAGLLATALLAGAGAARAQTDTPEWHAPMLAPGSRQPVDTLRPRWVDEPLIPSSRARIERVVKGTDNVVVLDGGYYQGFRNGVICVVQHGDTPVARLIVVATEDNRCAALILDQPQDVILIPGDQVRLSIL